MNVDIRLAKKDDRKNLEKLMQLYLHELSLYYPAPFNTKTCEYEYDNLNKYFEDNYAYFVTDNDNIVGFILVDDNKNNNYEISEIFVLNNYKRQKIGSRAVTKIFDMYRGNWLIRAVPMSKNAESFWIDTVNKYTNGNYKIEHTGKYNRAELSFKTKRDIDK